MNIDNKYKGKARQQQRALMYRFMKYVQREVLRACTVKAFEYLINGK